MVIAVAYIKGWFSFDVTVVTIDWVLYYVIDGASAAAMARTGKLLKVGRLIRLARLAKLRTLIETIQDRFFSEHAHVAIRVTRLMGFVLITCHLVACAWYAAGIIVRKRSRSISSHIIVPPPQPPSITI